TGMPTHQCGQYGLAHAEHNFHSFRRVKGLPALLAPAGYRSGVIAKLHVQPKEVYPFDVEDPGGGRNPVQMAEQAKKFFADAGVHLPLVVRRPGQKSGVVTSAMASWTDIAPTVLDWAGVKQPAELPGRSLLPVLEQEKPDGWDAVYGSHQFHEITMYYPMRMVRTRTHKYILNLANALEYPHASDLWGSDTWQGILKRGDKMMGQRSVNE